KSPAKELVQETQFSDPLFLTPERRRANLLADGSFEKATEQNWVLRSFRGNRMAASLVAENPKHGKRAVKIQASEPDDVRFVQKVAVKPNTRYLLSGWIKTKDVKIAQKGGDVGANLSLDGTYDLSSSLIGTKDWAYTTLVFNSDKRTHVEVR